MSPTATTKKLLEERRKSDDTAAIGDDHPYRCSAPFLALISGALWIAYSDSQSRLPSLSTNLMNVARGIGNTGDLEHNIDLSREE